MSLLIQGANIFDGRAVLPGLWDVQITGDKIEQILSSRESGYTGFEGEIIEAKGAWLIPGLIDLHVHLTWNGGKDPATDISISGKEENLLETVANTLRYLPHGITSVRDLGSPDDASIYVGKATAGGQLTGPRIFTSGKSLIMTGGHDPFHGLPVDGPWEALKGVRTQVAKGAQVIKISATGGVYGRETGEGVDDTELRQDELDMIIQEAHRRNVPVTAHAIGEKGIRSCLAAGIDCIEHGHYIRQDMAETMSKQGTAHVPTFFVYQHLANGSDIPVYARNKAAQVLHHHRQAITNSYTAGVLIGAGSDAGSPMVPHPALFEELLALSDTDLPPSYVLSTATANAGEILGLKDRLGVIKAGALADCILVSENPVVTLQTLCRPQLVVLNGRVIYRSDV